jgi:hypothetical protein
MAWMATPAGAQEPGPPTTPAADASAVSAADVPTPDDAPVPIPEPSRRPPYFAGEVHVGAVFPLARAPLCPPDEACILGGGAGVGGTFERRWVSGVSLGVVYDAWILNGHSVYEATVIQNLAALLRHRFLLDRMTHPFLAAAIGGLLLGDSFRVDAVGLSVEGHFGVEIEMSRSLALTFSTVWRLFVTSAFQTASDRVDRVQDQGANLAVVFRLGLVIQQ